MRHELIYTSSILHYQKIVTLQLPSFNNTSISHGSSSFKDIFHFLYNFSRLVTPLSAAHEFEFLIEVK